MDSLVQDKRARCDGHVATSRARGKLDSDKYWWVGHSHGPRVRGRKKCRSIAIQPQNTPKYATKIPQEHPKPKIDDEDRMDHFMLVAWKLLCNTVQRRMFCKLPPGKMLTSLLWFLSPFASHKSAKNLSWMAQGQKYVQGCVKAAFLIRTFPEQKLRSAAICTRGKKGTKWQEKGQTGVSQIPFLGHFEASPRLTY